MSQAAAPRWTRGYRIVRFVARRMLRSQFRTIEVEHADRQPAEGPVLIVANHFHSLVDPMMILHGSPRPVSFLAKAPLWKSALLRPFLDASGAVPVYRPQDRAENRGHGARANVEMFKACHERLQQGRILALFPEGVSQARPRLMPLRTGAARIAIDPGVPVAVQPVGLAFTPRKKDTRGRALITFGEPFVVNGAEGHASRRAAIAYVTRRIEADLRALLLEAPSQTEWQSLRFLREVWDQEQGRAPPASLAEDIARTREFADGLEVLREAEPAMIDELRAEGDAFQRALALNGIPLASLERTYSPGRVFGFLLRNGPLFLVSLPAALVAGLITWPARQLGDILGLRAFGGGEDVRALCRMLGSALLLVVLGIAGAVVGGLLGGPWWALGLLVAPTVLALLYISWRDHREEVLGRVRAFLLLAGGNLRGELHRQRRALYDKLAEAGTRLRALRADDRAPV